MRGEPKEQHPANQNPLPKDGSLIQFARSLLDVYGDHGI